MVAQMLEYFKYVWKQDLGCFLGYIIVLYR